MLLHFIFMVPEQDRAARAPEFEYAQKMSAFYGDWIRSEFGQTLEVRCDEMPTKPRGILRRLDTPALLRDHEQRGAGTYHFYLAHFRPLWTDCTCEGYHAENFGMVFWQRPRDPRDTRFLAEKNCAAVSHELLHELMRRRGIKNHAREVHDAWARHFYGQLGYEAYGWDHRATDGEPAFMTMSASRVLSGTL